MARLLVFGPGYAASHIIRAVQAREFAVETIGRATIADDASVAAAIRRATHILSSVPPDGEGDPVLDRHGPLIAASNARWIGYLSSSGVYGDTGGAWVDESAPVGTGRRTARAAADLAWQALHPAVRVFRLPGIYGPGRSTFDRLREGRARRIVAAGQVFSRIHVDDLAEGLAASIARPRAGASYNLCDDEPAANSDVVAYAARLLGQEPPPEVDLADAKLAPAAMRFYAESKRVSNALAKAELGWRPAYPTYREGLAAILAARG